MSYVYVADARGAWKCCLIPYSFILHPHVRGWKKFLTVQKEGGGFSLPALAGKLFQAMFQVILITASLGAGVWKDCFIYDVSTGYAILL